MSDIPPGFAPLSRLNGFTAIIMPVYERVDAADVALGLWVQPHHCNNNGIMHGGMIATLADLALGRAVRLAAGIEGIAITASLNIDFTGAAKLGDWLDVKPTILRTGKRLGFATCLLSSGDKPVAQASGVFTV